MTNSAETAGSAPAFPVKFDDGVAYSGITIRDYFAAKAMQVELAHALSQLGDAPVPTDDFADDVAFSAYDMADAMMRSRNE